MTISFGILLLSGLATMLTKSKGYRGSFANSCDGKVLILDVRNTSEWTQGHIACAVNFPLHSMFVKEWHSQILDLSHEGTSIPIIVYCRTGHRALAAAELLSAEGFANVMNGGGYNCTHNLDWNKENCIYPTLNQRDNLVRACEACHLKTKELKAKESKDLFANFPKVNILSSEGGMSQDYALQPLFIVVGVCLSVFLWTLATVFVLKVTIFCKPPSVAVTDTCPKPNADLV
jgi:rhodanese-related sulfurtransferase